MIVCWDRCSRPTILRPHSSFAGLFARSIARSISTSTTHESDLPHETCLNPQDCRTQGALEPKRARTAVPGVVADPHASVTKCHSTPAPVVDAWIEQPPRWIGPGKGNRGKEDGRPYFEVD